MPKATLTFKLPEEQEEFELALNAGAHSTILWELDQVLRGKIKYVPDSQSKEVTQTYQEIRDKLHELLLEYDVTI